MSTRRFRPSEGKRKAPRKELICHPVKPAASSKTAAKILHSEADQTGRTEEVEKKKAFVPRVNFFIKAWAKEPHFHMPAHSLSTGVACFKGEKKRVKTWIGGLTLGQEESALYQKTKAPHWYRRAGAGRGGGGAEKKKKIKPPGMMPSWSITLRFPIHFGQ